MTRLWVRLTLAFAMVILVTVGVVAVLASMRMGEAFRHYLSYPDPGRFPTLVDQLAEYYGLAGSWQGVGVIVEGPSDWRDPLSHMGTMRRRGILLPGAAPIQIVVADTAGYVIFDAPGVPPGRHLTADEQAAAEAILVDGELVGQLVLSVPPNAAALGPLERAFLRQLRWLLLAGGLLAGGIGVVLGLAMSRNLSSPLQRLAAATRALAQGDLSRRVEVGGSAEVAELGHAFNDMAAELERAERQRQNLVADVAHELRTPLSVLQGNLQAILDSVYPLDRAEIAHLYDETRLLSRLVDDLRELALVDAGQLRLNLQPTNVSQLLQHTMENLMPAAEAQDVALKLDVPDDVPAIALDPDRVAQVLRNLLLNALRHTPAGGSVAVTATVRQAELEIAVADTGEGIAAEDLSHIFERFWKADHSRSREERWGSGSGLGLSIARSLVEAHGGRMWVESQPGQGATFYLTLPLAAAGT